MNKLMFPTYGYPGVRAMGLLPPAHPATLPGRSPLPGPEGLVGPAHPATLPGRTPLPHPGGLGPPHGALRGSTPMGPFPSESRNEWGIAENTREERKYQRRNEMDGRMDEKVRNDVLSSSSKIERRNKRTNNKMEGGKNEFIDHETDRKRKREMEEQSKEKISQFSLSTEENETLIDRKIRGDGENDRITDRSIGGVQDGEMVEVRAATDIQTGVVLGPHPGALRLGLDLLEGKEAAGKTIWVCLDGDRVRPVDNESPRDVDGGAPGEGRPSSREGGGVSPGEQGPSARSHPDGYRESSRVSPGNYRWLAAIPSARDCHQQNVEAVQDSLGRVFYVTSRDVTRGDSLCVWYCDVMTHQLNVPVLTPENIRGGADYVCTKCHKSFKFPNVLKAHLMFQCESTRAESGAVSRAESRADSRAESRTDSKTEPRGEFRVKSKAESRTEFRVESRVESRTGSRMVTEGQPGLESRTPSGMEFSRFSDLSGHQLNPSKLFGQELRDRNFPVHTEKLDSSELGMRCDPIDSGGSPRDRPQASPDSTTPESPAKNKELQHRPGSRFRAEGSAFSRPPGKPKTGEGAHHRSSEILAGKVLKSEDSYKRTVLPPGVTMHSPRAFPSVTPAPPGGAFMGQLLMPRPQTKYSPLDAYALRYMYPEQIGNMAAAAALARYQQAMSLMSGSQAVSLVPGGPVRTGMPMPPPVVSQFLPTMPYMVPRPPPSSMVPTGPPSVNHCRTSPQGDPRGTHPAHSPEVSPSQLPYYPMPSDKEGEPLDLLPRSLYMSKDGRKGHLCIYCGKFYSRKYGLKIHLRTHTGYKPLKCKVCLRPFGDPSNLNKHIRLHAEGETPYRCQYCGKVLVRRRDLERHVKSRHPHEAQKDGLMTGAELEEVENLQNSSGSGEGRGTDTLLLGLEGNPHPEVEPHPEGEPQGHPHAYDDSDSSTGSDMEEEEEEIEVVELESSDLDSASLRLDLRC